MKENESPKSCTTVPLTSRGEVEPDRSWDVMKLFLRELELWRSILEARLHKKFGALADFLLASIAHLGTLGASPC
jgi:hypothetical protein